MDAARQAPRTLFSRAALVFVLLGTIVMLWPMALHQGHPFTMPDTFVYLDQGDRIWAFAGDMLAGLWGSDPAGVAPSTDTAGGASLHAAAADAGSVRSLPYAIFAGVLSRFGPAALAITQTAMVMTVLWAVVGEAFLRLSKPLQAVVAVLAATLTTLPFMASFAMPDILGAVLVLYALLLVRGIERFDRASQAVLTLLALAAMAAHYGNIPFGAVLLILAIILRALLGGHIRRVAIGAAAACFLAIGGNIALGFMAFDETSVTPRRFPIMLARSLEDGPARWYLQENCATESYAVCDYWQGDFPDHVGKALWGPRGMENAPPELHARIRAEETEILLATFRAYPLAQIASLTENAAYQFRRIGLDYTIVELPVLNSDGRRVGAPYAHDPLRPAIPLLTNTQALVYLASLVALIALLVAGPRGRGQKAAIILVLSALVVNAAIFGGLSAPNDRYQARIAWVAVLLAVIWGAEALSTRTARGAKGLQPAE